MKVDTPDGPLEAELVRPSGDPPMTVVLCHGLPSGTPRDPDDPGYPGLARTLASLGLAAVAFSFRGCHGSPGDMRLSAWIEDLRSIVAAVPGRVAVAGSSLGGATALLAASGEPRIVAVATLAAPAGLDELALDAFLERVRSLGLVSGAVDDRAWLDEFATLVPEQAAARLGGRPLLVVHGTEDDVVPSEHAGRITAAAGGPVTTVLLRGAGHQLRRDPIAIRVLFSWLRAIA